LLPSFNFVCINAMELQNPFDAYVSLWEAVSPDGEKRSAGVAAALLENFFVGGSGGNRSSSGKHNNSTANKGNNANAARRANSLTVLLLDEIDYLVTQKETLLYNLFDWPMRAGSNSKNGLVVIGISNTINLPERLHPRVQSRLGAEVCIFKSYNSKEVVDILRARLLSGEGGSGSGNGGDEHENEGDESDGANLAFDIDALTFAAKKTAGYTGDIRKAFQMCRAAAELVLRQVDTQQRKPRTRRGVEGVQTNKEKEKQGQSDGAPEPPDYVVRIADVQRATRAMLDSPMIKAVTTCTAFEALVLISLAALRSASANEEAAIGMRDLLIKMRAVASVSGDPWYSPVPSFQELIGILNRMAEVRTTYVVKALRHRL
jgi:origin recognition complex subunit 1